MLTYSSEQFAKDWRYAIDKDFATPDGAPYPFAENGRQQWGDEIKRIPFEEESLHDGCISGDGKRLAVAVGHDIYVFDTSTWDDIAVLKGHVTRVSALAFQPNDSNILVSSEQHDHGRSDPTAEPVIIVWKIDNVKEMPALDNETLGNISKTASTTVANKLTELGILLKQNSLDELEGAFTPNIARVVTKHIVADNVRIYGRLQTSFQSKFFSPSGKWMIYLPKGRPWSNSNTPWDICTCSTSDFAGGPTLTLKGHTDAIMWTGWNPDESLIGTVAWDGTIRIWDAATGKEIHNFETNRQNWTGAFSPDSKYFVATDGNGAVRVYDLQSDESTHWVYVSEKESRRSWRRAVAWHPSGKWIAVGRDDSGEILLLDIEKKEVLQTRTLSGEAAMVDKEELHSVAESFVGVAEVVFADGGNKLVAWVSGDSSVEVFDITQQVKWRFARGGTDDGPNADKWRDDNGKVTSKLGSGMLVWERHGLLMLASLDFDGVRVWSINLTEPSEH